MVTRSGQIILISGRSAAINSVQPGYGLKISQLQKYALIAVKTIFHIAGTKKPVALVQ